MFLHQFNATESEAKYGSVGVMTSGYVSKYGCFFFLCSTIKNYNENCIDQKKGSKAKHPVLQILNLLCGSWN